MFIESAVAESHTEAAVSYKPMRAPRGVELSCKGWPQEAALRMLLNSMDAGVAERPGELIVSSGMGKLAKDWPAFHAIVGSLRALEADETLVIQAGEPGPIQKSQIDAPRVVLVNPSFSAPRQDSDSAEAEDATLKQTTRIAADWMFTGPASALPEAHQVFRAAARKHFGGSLAGRLVVAGGMGAMGGAQALAATLNGAAFLGIDADAERIKRRLKAGYCEVMVNSLDEALRVLKNAVRKRQPASVGLIANASELIPELASRGVLPDLLTDQTPAHDPSSYIPEGFAVFGREGAQAAELRRRDPHAYREKALDSIATQVRGMLELRKMGAVVFEFGNGLCEQALARGVAEACEIPDFISEYLLPELRQGHGLLTMVALSGDAADLARVDALFAELFPNSELGEWVAVARRRASAGLPARNCWIGAPEAIKLSTAINGLVGRGEIKAPVAIGRSMRQMNLRHSRGIPKLDLAQNDNQASEVAALVHAASGASWLSIEEIATSGKRRAQISSVAVVADGKPMTAEHMESLFAKDFAT
jgi:urocanate hydratase